MKRSTERIMWAGVFFLLIGTVALCQLLVMYGIKF